MEKLPPFTGNRLQIINIVTLSYIKTLSTKTQVTQTMQPRCDKKQSAIAMRLQRSLKGFTEVATKSLTGPDAL